MNTIGTYNCGVCPKCLRTMVNLYAAGVLEQATTFPDRIDLELLAAIQIPRNEGVQITCGETDNLEALRAQNIGQDVQAAIIRSMERSYEVRPSMREKLSDVLHGFIEWVMHLDHLYSYGYGYKGLATLFGRKFS